jgi:hypothetical protein
MCKYIVIVKLVCCMQYAMHNMECLWRANPPSHPLPSCAYALVPVISMVEVRLFVLINLIVKQINFFIYNLTCIIQNNDNCSCWKVLKNK